MTESPRPGLRAHLVDEHVRLANLCSDVLATFERGDHDACDAAFRELEQRLEEHFTFEERELVPRLARVDREAAEEIVADHGRLRELVTELGVSVDLHAVRAHHVRALLAGLGAHASREGQVLYSRAGAAEVIDAPTPRLWMERLRAL
jgi:hypothetical protein